jgi:outer membrane protein assembly factor BamB
LAAAWFVGGMVGLAGAQDAAKPPAAWPQFRGTNACGLTLDQRALPVEFGPHSALWMTPLPPGHSSPCIWGDRIFLTAFDRDAQQLQTLCVDRADGKIGKGELPAGLLIVRRTESGDILGAEIQLAEVFAFFDADGDERYERDEWDRAVAFSQHGREHGLLAIRPGGQGDVTTSHVAWREGRSVAEVPSPLVYGGRVYMVKDGGILSCLDAQSGRLLYRTRLGPTGAYFSPPVAGDGKIYAASYSGSLVVFAAGDTFQRLAVNDLQESILATPAIADGQLYVRTAQRLYAFRP